MTTTNNPKTWLILLLLTFIFGVMLFIIRNHHWDACCRQKIDDHSDIVATV